MSARAPHLHPAVPLLSDDEWPLPLDCPSVATFDEVLGPAAPPAKPEAGDSLPDP